MTRKMTIPPGTITDRERQVLQALAAGKTIAQVARGLGLATNSVSMLLNRLATRLGTPGVTRTYLTVYCDRRGLLADPAPVSPIDDNQLELPLEFVPDHGRPVESTSDGG